MKKVVIADDDFIVRTYLKQMLNWENEGFLLIADVKNGKEALDICLKEQLDIIITDMSMPVMSGMDLIKELKNRNLPIAIVVLSCHDEFNYVKEAMQLGIADYLLKNDLTPEKLLSILNKIVPKQKDIHLNNDELQNSFSTQELAVIGKRKLQNDFYHNFSNTQLKNDDILLELAKKAGINSNFTKCNLILIELTDWQTRLNTLEHQDILSFNQAFKNMCQNICQKQDYLIKNTLSHIFQVETYSKFWCIILDFSNASTNSLAEIHTALQTISGKINIFTKRYFNLNTISYLTTTQKSLSSLKHHYCNLFNLTDYSFYLQAENNLTAITEDDFIKLSAKIADSTCDILQKLSQSIASNSEQSTAILEDFFAELYAKKYTKDILKQIISTLEIKLSVKFDLDYQEIANFTAFKEAITSNIKALCKTKASQKIEHPAIRNALKYIESHYKEPLSLQIVADYVHLNPAYFSTLFKKSMNKTFSDYLINYRLNKVKQRLNTDSDKIKNIALEEGFVDYQYFCKLFKRIVGKNPSEYRQ